MKKTLALLLAAVILLLFVACGSNGSLAVDVELPNNGKKGPSADAIQADAASTLAEINPYASLTGIETVKSLTEDGNYEITLQVSATTKYADWQYQISMYYTKYDQGWMLDNTNTDDAVYTIVQYPQLDEMLTLINEQFPNQSISFQNAVPASYGSVTFGGTLDPEMIQFVWTKVYECMHGSYTVDYLSYWAYNPELDEWELVPYNETENEDPCLLQTRNLVECSSDFSGTWSKAGFTTFTISNFTGDSFDAQWDENSAHFTISTRIGGSMALYTDGGNYAFTFTYKETSTDVSFSYVDGYDVTNFLSMISVTEELPPLS